MCGYFGNEIQPLGKGLRAIVWEGAYQTMTREPGDRPVQVAHAVAQGLAKARNDLVRATNERWEPYRTVRVSVFGRRFISAG